MAVLEKSTSVTTRCAKAENEEMMKYPNDANGDALRRMEAEGDDLSRPRNVEFTVVFPNENTAKQFANHFRVVGHTVSTELTGTVPDFPWDTIVVKHMFPSHEEIGAFEDSLQLVADTLGGRNDGWGCFSVDGEELNPIH